MNDNLKTDMLYIAENNYNRKQTTKAIAVQNRRMKRERALKKRQEAGEYLKSVFLTSAFIAICFILIYIHLF